MDKSKINKKYDFIAIDFETANRSYNSACSIGMAMVKDCQIVDTYYTLIQPPQNKYDPINIKVHGIKPMDTMLSDDFASIFPTVVSYINESHFVVAHNARFDMNVLYYSSNQNQYVNDFRYFDSIEFSNPAALGISGKLSERAKYFNISNDDHHNALNDAIVCAQIVIEAMQSKSLSLIDYLLRYPVIRIYNYSALYQKNVFKNPNYEKVNTETLAPTQAINDSPLKDKIFVFTGEFDYGKQALMQAVVNQGGVIKNSTVRNTDYLIVGVQDPKIVRSGISTKHRKALELIELGSTLKILNEKEILKLLNL